MIKKLLCISVVCCLSFASAATNEWSHVSHRGYEFYRISNDNLTLNISCNYAGPDDYEHDITISSDNTYSELEGKLKLVIDDTAYMVPKKLVAKPKVNNGLN